MYDSKKDKNKDDSLGLHSAAMSGNVGLVKFALDHGAAIDSVVNGYMPLQLACINENHMAVVQYLIDRGADVNAQRWSKKHSVDKSQAVAGATGSTALHVACANGCTKIVDLLLRNGARTDVKDKYGSKPIDVAAAKNHVEIVRLLETFEKMQVMLKGLQEGQKRHQIQQAEEVGRRSMDATLFHQQQKSKKNNEKLRRPSLPSVFDSSSSIRKLEIPDISTLPPRQSLNTPRPDEFTMNQPQKYYYHNGKRHYYSESPELTSSKSSSDETAVEKEDWYSYGVVKNHDEDENYLASLERRAYGITSPIATPNSYFSGSDMDDNNVMTGRASLDTYRRSSFESTPLKRCSSDGGRLRTTALMNSMAANSITVQEPENVNVNEEEDPSSPRPSLYGDNNRPTDLEQLKGLNKANGKKKSSWWSGNSNNNSANTGRKSMDIYPVGRPSLEGNNRRTSLDIRPSLDSLSQLAKKSFDGLSRKSIDTNALNDDKKSTTSSRGFLSKWWSNSTTANHNTDDDDDI